MRRLASALLLASLAGGCTSSAPRSDNGGHVASWDRRAIRDVPGVCGPYGERVPISAAAYGPQTGMPMMAGGPPMMPPGMMAPNGMPMMPPPNMIQQTAAFGPAGPFQTANNPMSGPPQMGGMMAPQMGGSGPASFGATAMNSQPRYPAQRTQVRFGRPSGMKVSWYTQGLDGKASYSSNPVDAPGRYNFPQAAIYRLKLANIEGRPGLEVYPTMEVVPTNPKTESFLQHSVVPVDFTPDDFKQIAEGAYIVKVIYLPDPQFQDGASTGTEEILSTRLEPGVDPIQEACRRGSILLVIRMGNIDQEAPNTPPLNASTPAGGMNPAFNYGPINGGPPGSMVPFGPMGGPGMSMPPRSLTAPGGLPPAISSMPLPKTGSPAIDGVPVNRPGTATAVPRGGSADLPPIPSAVTPPSLTPPMTSGPALSPPAITPPDLR